MALGAHSNGEPQNHASNLQSYGDSQSQPIIIDESSPIIAPADFPSVNEAEPEPMDISSSAAGSPPPLPLPPSPKDSDYAPSPQSLSKKKGKQREGTRTPPLLRKRKSRGHSGSPVAERQVRLRRRSPSHDPPQNSPPPDPRRTFHFTQYFKDLRIAQEQSRAQYALEQDALRREEEEVWASRGVIVENQRTEEREERVRRMRMPQQPVVSQAGPSSGVRQAGASSVVTQAGPSRRSTCDDDPPPAYHTLFPTFR